MNTSPKGTALITSASSGKGAVYADRLAMLSHDLKQSTALTRTEVARFSFVNLGA